MKNICGLILSAGYSSRMGSVKALLDIGGINLIDRTTQSLFDAGINDVFTVLGCHKDEILAGYKRCNDVNIVYNDRYCDGMFSSVQAGVKAIYNAQKYDAFLMMPVDCPNVNPKIIQMIVNNFSENEKMIIQPIYKGKTGHPCLISAEYADEILNNDFAEGMRTLISQNKKFVKTILVDDESILLDVDTQSEYLQLKNSILYSGEENLSD